MATTTTDPFAGKRGDPSHTPVNSLDSDQLDELKLEIRNMYKTTFNIGLPSSKKPETITGQVKDALIKNLEVALAMSPHFQKAVTEEFVTPYIHNFSALSIDEGWLLGLYLPGFYELFDDFDSGLKFIQKITPEACTGARKVVENVIVKHVGLKMESLSFDAQSGRSALRIAQTDPYVATLFQLVQEEKKQNDLRAQTYQNLNELEDMLPGLKGAEALQKFYKKKLTMTANESLIDRFTMSAIRAAKALQVPIELTRIDSKTVSSAIDSLRSLVDFAGEQVKELVKGDDEKQGREDDEPEEDEAHDDDGEVTVPGLSTEWEDVDGLPEEALVKQEVENHYSERGLSSCFYPGWCPPTAGSVFFKPISAASLIEASQTTSQESNTREPAQRASLRMTSTTVANRLKRAKGFISARQLSNKEQDDIDRKVHSPEDILNGALAYIKNTTKTDSDMFNARDYKECIKWLSAVKERSEKAKKAQSSDQWFRMFCGFQMEDNWFRVRSLLEALRVETEGRTEHGEMVTLMDGAEKNFIVVFSLIRSGSDDPMPWTLVVDGLLRFLWRSICRRMPRGEHTLLQKKIFNELALWCHGTAVNAFVVRLPHVGDRYVKGQTLMKKWYRMVWEYNPRCANDDCMRLLTHPTQIQNKEVRQLLSVGTREARIGTRSIRSFISTNRDNAYTCLFEVFRNSKPNQALVILLFWYSNLYHNRTCKAHAGKAAISAF